MKAIGKGTVLEVWTISDIATECRCVIKLQQEIDERPSMLLYDHYVFDSDIREGNQHDSGTSVSSKFFQTMRHKIKIQLLQGDIGLQKADIIVIGAASNLDLSSGSAFFSSLNQWGLRLQTDYNRLYPNGIQHGNVVVIDSGDFICDKIYLTSLPPWEEARCNGGKVLENFMRECLRLGDKNDRSTILFSSNVTSGHQGYPVDMAVSIMYGAVEEFDSSSHKTSLKDITIVINNEDNDIFKKYSVCHLKKQEREDRTYRLFIEAGTIFSKPDENSKYRMVKDGELIQAVVTYFHMR